MMNRRHFLFASAAAAAPEPLAWLRIGHRQASMRQSGPAVFDLARRIPGLAGVELQVHFEGQTLWDRDTILAYQQAAKRAGLAVPSLAGLWPKGVTLLHAAAEECLRKAVRAAETLGAGVLLAAAFRSNCPRMDEEASYGPVVAMLQRVAPMAAGAGVKIGLETSLSPADDRKLAGLVNHPHVGVYYDAFNVEDFGHTGQGVPGIGIIGLAHLCQVHCKNGARLLEEPGPVDWAAALRACKRLGYRGWYVFETSHSSAEQCLAATAKNVAFLRKMLG